MPKMSSYLVAMLVGDFVCREGSADGTAIRVCSTPDKLPLTGFALQAAEQASLVVDLAVADRERQMQLLASLPAVVDAARLGTARAEKLASKFGAPARTFAAVLADPDIDAVVNLTPPLAHLAVSLAALEAGKATFSEKPLGVELAEGRELGQELVSRHDEAFGIGKELLASVRAGWLEAMRADVGVERKL